ncbi:unnamed protein product [Linum trigynum]|uniref:adenylate dimethylallyltransferase (ADP/ATP-dependent) n=1 Tax=Linum trigynum TaxID=586398 RepID=A0AAV2CZE4_9ROSI
MRLSNSMPVCQQIQLPNNCPALEIPTGMLKLLERPPPAMWHKEKLVIIMGATGTGKSRLSVDLATEFHAAEIINSDKMQVYKGLDVVTNKITDRETRGVPHHLLGTVDPNADFTSRNFCDNASASIESILMKGSLPIIVGGSNSYIEALVDDDGDDEFWGFRSKYDCCCLWLDVSTPVLHEFVSKRVDSMVENGLVDEVRGMFDPEKTEYREGIRKSIGVPELDKYLRVERRHFGVDGETRARVLREAIDEIKRNTCNLASRQREKIQRLRRVKGWNIHRIDATEVFRKRGKEEVDGAWEKLVARPSSFLVRNFLYECVLT